MSDFATVVSRATITSAHENAKIDHAFEKADDYIVRKEGTGDYDVIYGGVSNQAGKIAQNKTTLVAAIQWAHNQLTNGGSICVKAGDYDKEWEAKLTISNSYIRLHGESHGTILKCKDSLNDYFISISGDWCEVSGFTFDGNKANQAPNAYGIQVASGAKRALITRNYLHDIKTYGITDLSGRSIITQNILIDIDSVAIYLQGTDSECVANQIRTCGSGIYVVGNGQLVVGNHVNSSTNYGIYVTSILNSVISNQCDGSTLGIYVNGGSKNTVMGNHNHDAYNHGIRLEAADENTIVGNICCNCSDQTDDTYDGIHLNDSDKNVIANNICNETGYGGAAEQRNGVCLDANCDYNIIQGNQCHGNDSYGIHIINNTCDKNLVHGNICLGNGTGQIQDGGTNTTSTDNIVA